MQTRFLPLLLLTLACNARPGEQNRRRFVTSFLESMRDDTAFFRGYVRDRATAESLRSQFGTKLTGDFSILNREDYGDGTYDYGVRCGRDLICIVFVKEQDMKVISADVGIEPRARAP